MALAAAIAFAEPDSAEPALEPDLELLEFLGSWETDDGEWVDPSVWVDELEAPAPPEKQEDD